jgi:hypothetical protein
MLIIEQELLTEIHLHGSYCSRSFYASLTSEWPLFALVLFRLRERLLLHKAHKLRKRLQIQAVTQVYIWLLLIHGVFCFVDVCVALVCPGQTRLREHLLFPTSHRLREILQIQFLFFFIVFALILHRAGRVGCLPSHDATSDRNAKGRASAGMKRGQRKLDSSTLRTIAVCTIWVGRCS